MSGQFDLQTAIVTALEADAGVAALVGGRIYDKAPSGAVEPYITFGPYEDFPDDAECIESDSFTQQLDIWSATGGNQGEAKDIVRAVRKALHGADLDLGASTALERLEVRRTQVIGDPKPGITHGIVILEGGIEHIG